MVTIETKISESLRMLTTELDKSLNSLNGDDLEKASLPLNQLMKDVRETIQDNLSEPAKLIINKLRKDQQLTYEETKLIEKWIVGDAEYYSRIENNFDDWVQECRRLHSLLSTYTLSSVEKLLNLNALLVDLKNTLNDVVRYVEARDRVKMFQSSLDTGSLSREAKNSLAEMIEQQLYSYDF